MSRSGELGDPRGRRPRGAAASAVTVALALMLVAITSRGATASGAQAGDQAATLAATGWSGPTLARAPSPMADARSLSPPAFAYAVSGLSPARQAWMRGRSWRPGCPEALSDLRELRLRYWGFDGGVHAGLLIADRRAVGPIVAAFRDLFVRHFPVRTMVAVDAYGASDERSMRADNTSAFNCRLVPGTRIWSQHARGLAVDVNPFENPQVTGSAVDPPAAWRNADRSRGVKGMIARFGAAWHAFHDVGWTWGGDWTSLKDYMHFSANGL